MTSIDLPNAKNQAAAVSYDGSLEAVYVARDGQLDVVDTAKKAVFKTVASLPHATAVTQDGSSVYVLAPGSQIEVVRKSDWTKEGDVSLPEPAVGSMWLDGKQDKLFVPTQQGNVLTLAGGGTPQVLGSTAVGQHLGAIAGSAGAVYMASGQQVVAMNIDSNQVSTGQALSAQITGLVSDDRTGMVWATTADHHVAVLDGKSLAADTTLAAQSSEAAAIDPSLRFVYTFGDGGFGAYDTNTNQQWAQVGGGDATIHTGTADPTNHLVYVYLQDLGRLDVYAWGVSGASPVTGGGGGGTAPLGAAGATTGNNGTGGAGTGGAGGSAGGAGGAAGTTSGAGGAAGAGSGAAGAGGAGGPAGTSSGPGGSAGAAGAGGAGGSAGAAGGSGVGSNAGGAAIGAGGGVGSSGAGGTGSGSAGVGASGSGSSAIGTAGTGASGPGGFGPTGSATSGSGSTGSGTNGVGSTGPGTSGSGAAGNGASSGGGSGSGTGAGGATAGSGSGTTGPTAAQTGSAPVTGAAPGSTGSTAGATGGTGAGAAR